VHTARASPAARKGDDGDLDFVGHSRMSLSAVYHSSVPIGPGTPSAGIPPWQFRVTESCFRPDIVIYPSEKRFDSFGNLYVLIKDKICISSGTLGMALDSLTHPSLKIR
ncbi:hypothetical protein Tco_0258583, partial [Tanacetum coccineum]